MRRGVLQVRSPNHYRSTDPVWNDQTWSVHYLAPAPTQHLPSGPPSTISVLIRAYQSAHVVGRAIESALAQTRPAHEIVVCDDGSTDAIDEAVASYRRGIIFLRVAHGGAGAALNHAIAAASGDFVAILDADDEYHPRRLEALTALLDARPDLDLVTTDAVLERDGQPWGRYYDTRAFAIADQRLEILRWCFVGGWPAIRRSRVVQLGGSDESLVAGEDWDLFMRMIFSGSLAGLVPVPLMTYRIHAAGLTSNRALALGERVRMLEKASSTLMLSADERSVLTDSLRRSRARARAAAAARELARRPVRARLRLARLALTPGLDFASRREIARLAADFGRR